LGSVCVPAWATTNHSALRRLVLRIAAQLHVRDLSFHSIQLALDTGQSHCWLAAPTIRFQFSMPLRLGAALLSGLCRNDRS
jgi:hypothetical protein